MAARAFLFDLDGTLWDSLQWYASLLSREGAIDNEKAIATLSAGTPVARLLQDSGITRTGFRALCSTDDLQAFLYPGVMNTLEKLIVTEIPFGIVTSLPGWMAEPILDRLQISGYVDFVIDYGMTSRHKPNPDPLLAALEHLGLLPSADIWYVGDTIGDFKAAKGASLSFACALYGYGSNFDGPDTYLTKFKEILVL